MLQIMYISIRDVTDVFVVFIYLFLQIVVRFT